MSVLVVGSFIVDCVARCNRAPEAGETVVGNSFHTYLGGKGANQAFASIRMGSPTNMAGAVGKDNFGYEFIETMKKEGFDIRFVKMVNNSTGTSLVTVEESGQNRICMTPGANLDYSIKDLSELEPTIKESNIIVTQLEMKYEIAKELSNLANKYQKRFILNPAPAREIDDDFLKNIYLITPNETELGIIIHKKLVTLEDYIEGAKLLLGKGVKNVIVTLGTTGSLLVNNEGYELIKAYKVKAVDTVGAGDSYTGSLASQLDQGKSILEAMKVATAVAALEVQRHGAIPAMPYKKEVEDFIRNNAR